MAEDLHYSSRSDHKRKFDDQGTPPSPAAPVSGRRSTGFSAPIVLPPLEASAPPSYNNVPPPPDGIQLAKQRAQEIAARIFSDAEAKRPRVENGSGADDSSNKGFDFEQQYNPFGQPLASQVGTTTQSSFTSYGYAGSSKKIDIPNGRVGVIIGKSGETIKYLQVQSGARIQVTRDMDSDPHSQCRPVEIIGTAEQISRAEQLINEVLAEAAAGGSGIISARKFTSTTTGDEHFSMKVPNNKVGLIIGKGGETIKNMQVTSGARIQVIPLRLLPGDPAIERTVHIDGTNEQIESAKQLVNDVISENRPRNSQTHGVYRPPRPPTSWAPPGAPPMQQPGYGYIQPGSSFPNQPPQYNLSQSPYGGYLPPTSTSWDQSSNPSAPQTTQVTGYEYYTQQPPPPPPPVSESSAPADSNSYNYSQVPPAYSAAGSYGDPAAYSQQAYAQPASYAQQGYGSSQDTQQGQSSTSQQQGYGALQPGYGMPGNSPAGQTGYGQKPSQPVTQGYSQPSPASGYAQPASYGQSYVQQQQQSYNDSYGGSYTQPSYSSDTTHGSYEAAPSSAPSGATKASPQS